MKMKLVFVLCAMGAHNLAAAQAAAPAPAPCDRLLCGMGSAVRSATAFSTPRAPTQQLPTAVCLDWGFEASGSSCVPLAGALASGGASCSVPTAGACDTAPGAAALLRMNPTAGTQRTANLYAAGDAAISSCWSRMQGGSDVLASAPRSGTANGYAWSCYGNTFDVYIHDSTTVVGYNITVSVAPAR